jgi:hypothetical protein
MLEKLLYDIVAKDVRHEGMGGRLDLSEDELLVGRTGTFQFLLDETRTMLVLREFDNMINQITKLDVWKPVIPAKQSKTFKIKMIY